MPRRCASSRCSRAMAPTILCPPMRRRLLLLASVLVLLVLAGAGSVYAFDHGRQDTIAKGVQVNGVDVGGLSVTAAKAKLRERLLDPLNRPVVVRGEGHRFVL